MRTEPITTLEQFVGWSRACSKRFGVRKATLDVCFRGQSKAAWALKPSIYRGDFEPDLERELIRDFKTHSMEFLDHQERNDVDWLFLAQHHGIPTRLLDWTTNALVALYFACEKFDNGENGKVWALNSWELNSTSIDMHAVPPTDSSIFQSYIINLSDEKIQRRPNAILPMAVRPNYLFRRSAAQSGCFTIHGTKNQALDKLRFRRKNTTACFAGIEVEASRKMNLLRELYAVGIHSQSLFQSIDSVSERVKFRYSRNYYSIQ